ncbi:MAG: nucleoside deaminase [Epulopiscium sp.]|nr:nucleoside deaminase [Candidatus Epulonipiscium sp.]
MSVDVDIKIHEKYMKKAILLARKAFEQGEVPIGALIVYKGEIIGQGFNQRNTKKNPLAHAEIQAIYEAAQHIGDWRLEECQIYITLEPCPMCAGAIIQARIPQVILGAKNPKAGCGGSILNILQEPKLNHQAEIIRGVLQEEASTMLKEFFKELRKPNSFLNGEKEPSSIDDPS